MCVKLLERKKLPKQWPPDQSSESYAARIWCFYWMQKGNIPRRKVDKFSRIVDFLWNPKAFNSLWKVLLTALIRLQDQMLSFTIHKSIFQPEKKENRKFSLSYQKLTLHLEHIHVNGFSNSRKFISCFTSLLVVKCVNFSD